jgi:hypothetical protein
MIRQAIVRPAFSQKRKAADPIITPSVHDIFWWHIHILTYFAYTSLLHELACDVSDTVGSTRPASKGFHVSVTDQSDSFLPVFGKKITIEVLGFSCCLFSAQRPFTFVGKQS